MFETCDVEAVRRLTVALSAEPTCLDDAELVAEIRALATELTESRGTALEVALARRESHHRGRRHLGLARIASREMPHLWSAWRAGRVSEWRVTLAARETGCLTLAHRRRVDGELAADLDRLEAMGDRELIGFCRSRAAALDPGSVVARRRRAESERRVTIRPAPDSMVYLTALLPVAVGVAAYATLSRVADTSRCEGQPRSRGQVMADALAAALTDATKGTTTSPATTIDVVMSDRALFSTADDPALLDGYGVVDADLARELALGDRVWLRRLFAEPGTGTLMATDSTARRFPAGLRRLIRLRDQQCRTPWCDAPIRHADHSVSRAARGETSLANGQGLCEACNQAKETMGRTARPRPGPGHTIEVTTPAGQEHLSRAPTLPIRVAS